VRIIRVSICLIRIKKETQNLFTEILQPVKTERFTGFFGNGGERGIRTPDTRKGIHAFEARAFSHSAISPR
jgi:hypothetical protein